MADIFISYAREDAAAVEDLAAHLQVCGWSVWWDRRILAGKEFDEVIEAEIQAAGCVLVVWTKHSVQSRWVKVEAGEGRVREILIPVRLDGCVPPLAFRNVQSVSLPQPLDPASSAFKDLVEAITQLVAGRTPGKIASFVASPVAALPVRPVAAFERPAPVAPTGAPDRVVDDPGVVSAPPETERTRPWVVGRRMPYLAAAALAVLLAAAAFGSGLFSGAPETDSVVPSETVQPAPLAANEARMTAFPALSDEDIRVFVTDYLSTVSRSDTTGLLNFYADRVDYYNKGTWGHDDIRRDKSYYFNRWPTVSQALQGDVSVTNGSDPETKIVSFSSVYDVRSPARSAHATGSMQTTLVVMNTASGIRIISQRETSRPTRQ